MNLPDLAAISLRLARQLQNAKLVPRGLLTAPNMEVVDPAPAIANIISGDPDILRAVNNFQPMLGALKEFVSCECREAARQRGLQPAYDMAVAAIASAEKGGGS